MQLETRINIFRNETMIGKLLPIRMGKLVKPPAINKYSVLFHKMQVVIAIIECESNKRILFDYSPRKPGNRPLFSS